MGPENEARLANIKRLSRVVQAICILYMAYWVRALFDFIIGPIFGPAFGPNFRWNSFWSQIRFFRYFGIEFTVRNLTLHDRLLALALYTLTSTIAFLCGLQLFRLLGFYSRGEIFTTQSVRQIRLWGFACMAWGAIKVVWIFVPHVVANSRRREDLDLTTVLIGLIIVAISWFMEMAAEMREENELTV